MSTLKCIVVDDSALSRKIVRTAVESLDSVEVIAVARDGLDAVERCKALNPDFVTMDMEMPRMDGIQAMRELKRICPATKVIMVSSLTAAGAAITTQALQAGAFDFVLKPVARDVNAAISQLAVQLAEKVAGIREQRGVRAVASPASPPVSTLRPSPRSNSVVGEVQAICIGVSTGGPVALSNVIPRLPANLPVPIFVVQHMPPVFTKSLAEQLDRDSGLRVVEAVDRMQVEAGTVYIAPGGKQMKLINLFSSVQVAITDDPPMANARPSVDYLFRSAAAVYSSKLVSVVLTGMGNDGLQGCRAVKQTGGYVMTQDASSCVVYGMPRCVAEAGLSDRVLALDEVVPALVKIVGERATACR